MKGPGVAVVVGAVLAASCTPAPGRQAVSPGDRKPAPGRIVFVSDRAAETALDVYSMSPDGSDQVPLTDNRGHDHQPAWSPDGSRVAYSSGDEGKESTAILSIAPDGSGVQTITDGWTHVGMPRWSPDGERIVVAGDRGDGMQIYVVDVADGDVTPITRMSHPAGAYQPDFSPDGNRIVHMRVDVHGDETHDTRLYVMDADGRNVSRLQTGAASESDPAWSPDGSKIAFVSGREGTTEIYVVNADGTDVKRVTDDPADDFTPEWSPDGSRIVFASDRDGKSDIYVANADGSGLTQLTDDESDETNPDWLGDTPASSPIPWQEVGPGWTRLAPPPEPRTEAATAWAASEEGLGLFLWGGYTGYGGSLHADGFVWSPHSNRWRESAPSPLAARAGSGAVFTGREVVVWGGYGPGERPLGDGAAYDPRSDAWRMLPDAPIAPAIPVAAVWTGEEAIFWGSTDLSSASTEGAAYDPVADRWRRLAPAPFAINEGTAVWADGDPSRTHEMIVLGALLDGNNASRTEHAAGLAYDPASDRWREIAPSRLSPQASAIAWTGAEVIAWDYRLRAASYDPGTDRWRSLPDVPLEDSECYPASVAAGGYVMASFCGQAALWDVDDGGWREIPMPRDVVPGAPVVAGHVVLFAGATHESTGSSLWAYAPPPALPE